MGIFNLIAAVSAENLKKSLEILWKGSFAIAIVLVLVFAATKIVTIAINGYGGKKLSKEKALQDKQDAAEQEQP